MGRFSFNRQHIPSQLLLRSWPFPRGSGRLTDRLFSGLSFARDAETIRTTDGVNITVRPNDHIGRHLYLTGEFDRSSFETLYRLSRPGDVLLDIGAHIGYVSTCFLNKVARSKVIVVEPQPEILDLLRINLQQFGDRCRIFPFALSNTDGAGYMEICGYNKGASRVVSTNEKDTIPIRLCSAANLIETLALEKLDLIKIDVEGHEEQVLSSLLPALKNLMPRAILYEDHGTKSAPSEPIGRMLKSAGFSVHGIKKRLTKLDWVPIKSADDCVANDYIALRTIS